ncbi:hypothetical protein ACIBBG_31800 [Micromonospora chersina]|uniref:hypothetical protein n=1 Tax=Micromonospora chersina TaxID=47854 RepID=UPI0037A97790
MDPITAKIAASVAASLFGRATKPIGAAARDAVLGKRETHAAEKAIRRAVDRGVEEVCADGVPPEVVQHVLLMIYNLVQGRHDLSADILGQQDDDAALRYWTRAAEAAGWDLATFPVHFPDVIRRVTRHIPDEMRAMAGEAESPLHNRVVLTVLGKVESQLADLQRLNTIALSRDVPLADPLRKSLERAKATARATDSRFLTPHLLLALVRPPSTAVRALLDRQRAGLVTEIEGSLAGYIGRHRVAGFADFDWRERPDVQAARVVAIRQGAAVLTDRLLLVGVLETPSNTSRQLAAWLGDELLAAVKREALTSPAGQAFATPGAVFGASGSELA